MLSESERKVKQQLEDFNQSKRKIRNLKHELQELLELGTLPKHNNGGMPTAKGGHSSSPQEKFILKVEALQEKIVNAIDDALQKEHNFLESIESLDSLSQNLLMERYMQGKPMQQIIKEFNYSEKQIYNLYNKSYRELANNDVS